MWRRIVELFDFLSDVVVTVACTIALAAIVIAGACTGINWMYGTPSPFPSPNDTRWVVVSSEINDFGERSEVRQFTKGSSHGEMWLLDGKPYKASFTLGD